MSRRYRPLAQTAEEATGWACTGSGPDKSGFPSALRLPSPFPRLSRGVPIQKSKKNQEKRTEQAFFFLPSGCFLLHLAFVSEPVSDLKRTESKPQKSTTKKKNRGNENEVGRPSSLARMTSSTGPTSACCLFSVHFASRCWIYPAFYHWKRRWGFCVPGGFLVFFCVAFYSNFSPRIAVNVWEISLL